MLIQSLRGIYDSSFLQLCVNSYQTKRDRIWKNIETPIAKLELSAILFGTTFAADHLSGLSGLSSNEALIIHGSGVASSLLAWRVMTMNDQPDTNRKRVSRFLVGASISLLGIALRKTTNDPLLNDLGGKCFIVGSSIVGESILSPIFNDTLSDKKTSS